MYFEVRRNFTSSTSPITLRTIVSQIGPKVEHKEEVTIKLRAFPVLLSNEGFGLTLYREGMSPDNGELISNPGHGGSMLEVRPGNDPAWLDSLSIGRHSTSTGDWTLVAIMQ